MDPTSIVAVVVAVIAALSSFASQRSSAQAAGKVQVETSRVDMEKNAYERARAFDTETIVRQNIRISELVRDVKKLEACVGELKARLSEVEHPT